ncbi:MAG: preprotein translocase subunit SecG [Bacteroidetes bacterium]|nr:preprotein translocase subunit SecG [Bacteroidota bacterium]
MGVYIVVSVLILIASALMVLVVLVQNSKGGGLASNFASSNQFMGVRKTADFLEKTTWTLAIVLLVLSLFSIFSIPKNQGAAPVQESEIKKQIDQSKAAPVKDFQPSPGEKKK